MQSWKCGAAGADTQALRWWRWRLRLLAALGGGGYALLVGLLVWWQYAPAAWLREELESIRARGERIALADFECPPVKDEDDAAPLLWEAGKLLDDCYEGRGRANEDGEESRPRPPSLGELYDRMIRGQTIADEDRERLDHAAPALKLVRAARDKRATAPDRVCEPQDCLVRLSWNTLCRDLSYAAELAALQAAHEGRAADAIDHVADAAALERSVSHRPWWTLAYFSKALTRRDVLFTVEHVLPYLNIAAPQRGCGKEDPDPARVRLLGLRDQLLDEREEYADWGSAVDGERRLWYEAAAVQVPTLPWLADSTATPGTRVTTPWSRLYSLLEEPSLQCQVYRRLRWFARVRQWGRAENWSDFTLRVPARAGPAGPVELVACGLAPPMPMFGTVGKLAFANRTFGRLAATAIALRLYRADHGAWPTTLDEPVPAYLPSVPRDPFAAPGTSIRYAPHLDPPRVYSVWLDGHDDGGEAGDIVKRQQEAADLVFYCDGVPRGTIDRDE